MSSVSAVLLAAGQSRRMQDINKLILPVMGVPLLRRTAETLIDAGITDLVVVIGHQADVSKKILKDLPLRVVENVHYQDGQMTSVHAGLSEIKQHEQGVMICLTDLPLLTVSDVQLLINVFNQQCETGILLPTYQGKRGNPIILSSQSCDAIISGERNLGCKRLIEKNPDWTTTYEMPNDHVVFDLDTFSDYQRLHQRLNDDETKVNQGM